MPNKIRVNGVIVGNDLKWIYDWFEITATCPDDVIKALDSFGEGKLVEVEINSGGGSVWAGSEMYYALKSYKGEVHTIIPSIAASAASVIAMGGKKVFITPTAQIMIHNTSGRWEGDYRDMEKGAEVLKNYNTSIANAYQLKTGMPMESLLELMNKETYMTAQQAKELKFVDEILFDDKDVLVANAYPGIMLPSNVINKVRNLLQTDKKDKTNEALAELERLELLKLRGKIV